MPAVSLGDSGIVTRQRAYFETGATRPLSSRVAALTALGRAIREAETSILDALHADLGKPASEAYASEVGLVLADIAHACRNLGHWMRPVHPRPPVLLLPGRSVVLCEPRGVTLILSPWNYPFQLACSPLVASLAAGNTAILKPSEHAPRTAAVLAQVVRAALPSERACVVVGGVEAATALLEQRFDHIFFTGSTAVGRHVAQAAARTLTPCTLELGGKSPCIVCADANLSVAARRIVWGKFLNAGQTCVAPDFIWADRRIAAALLEELAHAITLGYGADPRLSSDYGRIVSTAHLDRLRTLLQPGRIVCGGEIDREARYLAPTVITEVPADARILHEEVFGPILPVRVYDDLAAVLQEQRRQPIPLALYVFSESRLTQDHILAHVRSGGACVNDTILHLLNPRTPFGGLGDSGMGAYHGRAGFDTFSHHRSVLRRGTRCDPTFRYPPARMPLRWFRRLLPWLLR